MRSSARLFLLAGLGLTLGACASIKSTVSGPRLASINPQPLAASMSPSPTVIASSEKPAAPAVSTANSLWRPGARAFFIDQRASKPGDILTVLINVADSAKVQNDTSSSRQNATKGSVPHFLGLETAVAKFMPKGFDPANAIDQSGNTSSAGSGSINRQEQVSMTIAAVVTGVLPNGNLVIQGSQQMKTNNEMRVLTISGIVRPEDISSENTIHHTQIAEARIAYGGEGDLSRVQRTPYGQALAEQFSPF
jgi:flagellar L-ring protein precursor FlgH